MINRMAYSPIRDMGINFIGEETTMPRSEPTLSKFLAYVDNKKFASPNLGQPYRKLEPSEIFCFPHGCHCGLGDSHAPIKLPE